MVEPRGGVALVLGSLAAGGIERTMPETAVGIAGRGIPATLIVRDPGGPGLTAGA